MQERRLKHAAIVVELADTQASEACARKGVEVRVLSIALNDTLTSVVVQLM